MYGTDANKPNDAASCGRIEIPSCDAPDADVVFFDGVCNLCNLWVQFILKRDAHGRFRFAPLQSTPGRSVLDKLGLSPDELKSIILVRDGRAYQKSDAALRILGRLPMPWRLLSGLIIVPRPLRDAVYKAVASVRYRWFGKRDACMVPTPEQRDRFLT